LLLFLLNGLVLLGLLLFLLLLALLLGGFLLARVQFLEEGVEFFLLLLFLGLLGLLASFYFLWLFLLDGCGFLLLFVFAVGVVFLRECEGISDCIEMEFLFL
jgi:hypothetical protein